MSGTEKGRRYKDVLNLLHGRRVRSVREALARLVEEEGPDPDAEVPLRAADEDAVERRLSLNEQRLGAVLAALKQSGARRVLDLGCGEGRLLERLLADRGYEEIVGMDVSYRCLEIIQHKK